MVDSPPPPPPAPPCPESLLFLFSRTRWDERRLEGPSLWDVWEGVRGQGETKAGKKQIIAHKANSVPVCATGLLHQEGDLRCPFLKHHEDSNTTTTTACHRRPPLSTPPKDPSAAEQVQTEIALVQWHIRKIAPVLGSVTSSLMAYEYYHNFV